MQTPSREEILNKYRDLIDEDDFVVLSREQLPSPSELQVEGAWLQKLGPVGDCVVWLKRTFGGVVVAIALYGSFVSGLREIPNGVNIAFDSVQSIAAFAHAHTDEPADRYAFGIPEQFAALSPPPPSIPSTTTTTTTTQPPTTTTPEPQSYELPSGSGVAPYRSGWEGYA